MKLNFTLLAFLSVLTGGLSAQIQFTMINPQNQEFTITNYGANVDISSYRLCSEFVYASMDAADVEVLSGSLNLAAGQSVTARWTTGSGFTNTASDMGLYFPVGAFTDPGSMVCFVQYGAGDQGREDVAVAAGLWAEDTFVTGLSPYTYTGDGTQSGVEFWQAFVEPVFPYVVINEVDSDTPGTDMMEFVELYGDAGGVLDGLVVVFINGLDDASYAAYDLDGMTLNGEGFFLLANAAVPGAGINFPGNSLQNGADAVAIYQGSASDWPSGTPITSTGLIDLLVYDTDDADDTGLLALLSSGTQINESQGGNSSDLSCSRWPDGGVELSTTNYVAQLPTPGYSNVAECDAGSVSMEGGVTISTMCTGDLAEPLVLYNASIETGATYVYLIADGTGAFIEYQTSPLDLSSLQAGVYQIFGYSYTGNESPAWEPGVQVSTLATDDCFSLSENFIELTIEECAATCVAGSISLGEGIMAITICDDAEEDFVNLFIEGNDTDAGQAFVVTDVSNQIVSFVDATFDLNQLDPGTYRIWSISYIGVIDISTNESGDPISGIIADCIDITDNFVTANVVDCSTEGCSELFFSEYLEGTSNNKALEIYNPRPFAVDLSEYQINLYFNGNAGADDFFNLSGFLEPGASYVIVNPQSDQALLDIADAIDNICAFNGDDAIELRHNSVVVDVIGEVGVDPGTSWPVGTGTTRDNVLRRMNIITVGTDTWADGQLTWDVFEASDYSDLGAHVIIPCANTSIPYVFFDEAFSVYDEDAGTVSVSISVLNPLATVDVTVSVNGGDATAGEDYTSALPVTLTFAQGTTEPQFVTLDIVDDLVEEGIENIILNLSGNPDEVNFMLATHNLIINANDIYYAPYTIEEVTGVNDSGVADSVGIYCELQGVVHGPNLNSAGVQFTLIDPTDGILIFSPNMNFGYNVTEGDEVVVGGEIFQFAGMTQLMPHYITLVSSGNALEEPQVITVMEEEHESHMVRVECVSLVNPNQWTNSGSQFVVQITDGNELFDMVIDGDTELYFEDAPEGSFTLTGIGYQFDESSPYHSGYRIYPRYNSDISNEVVASFIASETGTLTYGDDGLEITYTYNGEGAVTWDWDLGDGSVSSLNEVTHQYDFDFLESVNQIVVTLVVTNENGCSDETSIIFSIDYVGLSEAESAEIRVYPNPAGERFTVEGNADWKEIAMYNLMGEEVMKRNSGLSRREEIEVSHLASGIYTLRVQSDEGFWIRELVIR